MALGGKTLTVYLAADLKKFNSGMAQAQTGVQGFGNSLNKMLGPALIGAGVAAGAFATKLAVDGVKSAMEDEAAVAKLATTLKNLGFDDALTPLEAYIAELELATGIVDNELRAAFERLVRSTGDVEEAQKALQISVDVSASKGKDLMQVADSLGKAYDGQVTSIQRLGTGISNATILSKDMGKITGELQSLFAGQAKAAASTYEGQINRLSVSFENLKESFGAGFLDALGDTNDKTDELMGTMKDLGPLVEALGDAVGEAAADFLIIAKGVADLANNMQDLNPEARETEGWLQTLGKLLPVGVGGFANLADTIEMVNAQEDKLVSGTVLAARALGAAQGASVSAAAGIDEVGDAASESGAKASTAAIRYLSLAQAMAAVGGSSFNWRREVSGATDQAQQFALDLDNLNINRKYDAWLASQEAAANKALSGSQTTASSTTKGLTEAEKHLTEALEKRISKTEESKTALDEATSALEKQVTQIDDYAASMQKALTGGLDLAAAYSGQFTKEGESTGVSLIEGFNAQIAQAEWFGNVLGAIKAQGADQTLLEEIAGLGPEVGGALGQQMLDEGLVPTLSDKWAGVQQTTNDLAMQLVPGFMTAGLESGIATVDGLATQFEADKKKLGKLGKEIAKPVGANFRAQLLADVAQAVKDIEASATAARAEKVAAAAAQQARLTDQAVAQALGRLISNSDQRAGTNIAPVLT